MRTRTRAPLDFGANASLAFLPDGSFLLADGYWNSRIVKYNADARIHPMEWGELGTGPDQFDLVQGGVDVDRNGRVYLADRRGTAVSRCSRRRENRIAEWPDVFFPVDISLDENDAVWVVSALLNKIMKYNTSGELQYTWGTYGHTGPVFGTSGVADGFGPSGSPERWREAIGASSLAVRAGRDEPAAPVGCGPGRQLVRGQLDHSGTWTSSCRSPMPIRASSWAGAWATSN